jgi:single-strand selective monofunctional uracil DNA glycosylase
MDTSPDQLIAAARALCDAVEKLRFSPPMAHVYNPLTYAWTGYEAYARRFGNGAKNVIFLGMNPGPFGMMQTGVPFGEIAAVRDWLGIQCSIASPPLAHPKRPILGFACPRSEVSGKRLWGLFAQRFATPERFFASHFVANYCPLAFLRDTGANHTPDKLPSAEAEALYRACDVHLRALIGILRPSWIVGVGAFATERARLLASGLVQVGQILHPSPACPAANRDWAGTVTRQMREMGIWKSETKAMNGKVEPTAPN